LVGVATGATAVLRSGAKSAGAARSGQLIFAHGVGAGRSAGVAVAGLSIEGVGGVLGTGAHPTTRSAMDATASRDPSLEVVDMRRF
jgi:hypothetical protein